MNDLVTDLRTFGSHPVFVTGAGISVASGIPTFRGSDPDAVWSKDVLEMGTYRFFKKDPVAQWSWYLGRFKACYSAKPNPAHVALVQLEQSLKGQGRQLTVVTQNIDGLHYEAGSKDLIEIHGAARKLRCSAGDNCLNGLISWDESLFDEFIAHPHVNNLPTCRLCGALLRPHVLWFDECYDGHEDYKIGAAQDAFVNGSMFIFVGTSFSVGITAMALDMIHMRGCPAWLIDPVGQSPSKAVKLLKAPSEVALPEIVRALV